MKYLFLFICAIAGVFLVLKVESNMQISELPIFLRQDEIALNHSSQIDIYTHSLYQPSKNQLRMLTTDYSNIWAHLNHLYGTNDIESGKEYYTEEWFRQLALHYEGEQKQSIRRTDEKHELHIINWASDGLVCNAIDSNVVFSYFGADKSRWKKKTNLAVVLIYQGDHYRMDAVKVLDECNIK